MTVERRELLLKVLDELEELKGDVYGVLDDEKDDRENCPDKLRGGRYYERMETAVSCLEYALDELDAVICGIEEACA